MSNEELKQRIIGALRTVYDPEIPVDIWELGLVYGLALDQGGRVAILMTLTSPACPVAEELPAEVEQRVAAVPGVTAVRVDVVWEPPWGPERLSEAARLELGLD
jgi:FeS assembly SUF system protein